MEREAVDDRYGIHGNSTGAERAITSPTPPPTGGQPGAGTESSPDAQPGDPRRILLAEDNFTNQGLIKTLIERKGWQVLTAGSGKEVLDILAAFPVDLVLMDIQMPDLNGLEATRIIRSRENGTGRIPIIGLSAASLLAEREKCLAAGMDDFIAKPFKSAQLYAAIYRQLALLHKEEAEAPVTRGEACH